MGTENAKRLALVWVQYTAAGFHVKGWLGSEGVVSIAPQSV